jgi:ubiquinone/menaquinone biosynthesis C-methylase UbiE
MSWRRLRRELSHRVHLLRPAEFAIARQWLDAGAGGYICDVGCGDGYWISRLAGDGRNLLGLDLDPEATTRAHRHYGRVSAFAVASGERLPLKDGSVDKLLCLSALMFFPSDLAGLKEMHRVLRPGGRLCLSLDSLSLPSISAEYKLVQAQRYGVRRLYTHRSFEVLLREAGFSLQHYEYVARTRVSAWFIQYLVQRGWEVNYLAPISLPVSRLADALRGRSDAGYSLVVAVEKGG